MYFIHTWYVISSNSIENFSYHMLWSVLWLRIVLALAIPVRFRTTTTTTTSRQSIFFVQSTKQYRSAYWPWYDRRGGKMAPCKIKTICCSVSISINNMIQVLPFSRSNPFCFPFFWFSLKFLSNPCSLNSFMLSFLLYKAALFDINIDEKKLEPPKSTERICVEWKIYRHLGQITIDIINSNENLKFDQ